MVRLLAMILTAYDPRRNPAAGLLWSAVSNVLDSVAKLTEPSLDADASAATAEDYTKKLENMHERYESEQIYRARGPSGRILSLKADRYA